MKETPWHLISAFINAGEIAPLELFLRSLMPAEVSRVITQLRPEERQRLLKSLSPAEAAHLLVTIPESQAAELLLEVGPAAAASIIKNVSGNRQADLLSHIPRQTVKTVLGQLNPDEAADLQRLLSYHQATAGALMTTQYLAYPETFTVRDILEDLRKNSETYADYDVQYVYVVSYDGKLKGVLRLRDLVLKPGHHLITHIMIANPVTVPVRASLETLQQVFQQHAFIGIPVVDSEKNYRLLGVVNRGGVQQATEEYTSSALLKLSGIVGGEELRLMPFRQRALRRLIWLSANIVLNILAASVIACYQDTLALVITLAVFLPIISDMSGCAGNQAVAVSLRELILGVIRPGEFGRIFAKEISVGVFNGAILGAMLGGIAFLWQGNPWLGLVIGSALALNTVVASLLGGALPLLLKRLRVDPALVSGPILTTITDMCGFFFVLSFANYLLRHLTR